MTACWEGRTKRLPYLISLFAVILVSSCTDEENSVGGDLVGQRNPFAAGYDTPTLIANTVIHDSFPTNELPYYMLGSLHDEEIGTSSNTIITQYELPYAGFSFGTSPRIDSIVLQLPYATSSSYYGDKGSAQHIKVFELDEQMDINTDYWSDRSYFIKSELADFKGSFYGTADSVTIHLGTASTKLAPHVRIRLDQSSPVLRNRFLASGPGDNFVSQSAFKSAFKGLVIMPVDTVGDQLFGAGCISYINLNQASAAIVVYYNDSLKAEFPTKGTVHANKFNHYYNQSIAIQPNFSDVHSDVNYLVPGAGLKTRIRIPYLLDLVKNQKVAITGAEFVFTAKAGTTSSYYSAPMRIVLAGADSLGQMVHIPDLDESIQYYGGLQESGVRYRFNVIKQIQYILNEYQNTGRDVNYGFNLFCTTQNPVTAQRLILDTRSGSGNFKLNLTYTVIKK